MRTVRLGLKPEDEGVPIRTNKKKTVVEQKNTSGAIGRIDTRHENVEVW